jgi:predicted nucleic acid-binding protein
MAGYFFDSSALVKFYLRERGSAWVRRLINRTRRHDIAVVRITGVEAASALVRHTPPMSRAGLTTALSRLDVHFDSQFLVLPVDRALVAAAIHLTGRHRLRGYDAVQLAAALGVRRRNSRAGAPAPILVSADLALNAAAAAEGFAVDDPNRHP